MTFTGSGRRNALRTPPADCDHNERANVIPDSEGGEATALAIVDYSASRVTSPRRRRRRPSRRWRHALPSKTHKELDQLAGEITVRDPMFYMDGKATQVRHPASAPRP
jgi:hypothetical protein